VDFGQCGVDCDVTHYLGAAISSHNRPVKFVDMTDDWRHTLAMLPLDPVDLSTQESPAGTPIRRDHPGGVVNPGPQQHRLAAAAGAHTGVTPPRPAAPRRSNNGTRAITGVRVLALTPSSGCAVTPTVPKPPWRGLESTMR
jgi:hypothetical protein